MKKISIILVVLLAVLLGSCVKDANLKISSSQKLVVYCVLSPEDSVTYITVEKNKPLGVVLPSNDYNPNGYTNAEVELSDGNKTLVIRYDMFSKVYMFNHKDFDIKPGVTYTLKVKDLENGSQVQATTQVPMDLVQNMDVEVDSILGDDGDLGRSYYATIKWDDIVGKRNFYAYDLVYTMSNTVPPQRSSIFSNGGSYIKADDKVVDGRITGDPQRMYLYDSDFDTEVLRNIKLKVAAGEISIYVYNMDNALYDYLEYSSLSVGDGEESIFKDPVTVYTNIEGGLGVFGSYRETKRIIDKLK